MAKILPTFSVNCMLQTVVQFDRKFPGFILIYQQLSHFSESDCDILFMFPVWNALQVPAMIFFPGLVLSNVLPRPDRDSGHTHQSRTRYRDTLPAILRTTLSALSSWSTDNGWFLCQSSRETRSYSIVELGENQHCFQATCTTLPLEGSHLPHLYNCFGLQ